jgi:hypothetical protein
MMVLSTFTKPFPNTIYWNPSKHGGVNKKIRTKEIEFKSNEGVKRLSYSDFISIVRKLFACALTLTKINLVISFTNCKNAISYFKCVKANVKYASNIMHSIISATCSWSCFMIDYTCSSGRLCISAFR